MDAADSLAKRLGYLPLALAQAAAYMKKNPITFTKYLKLYDTSKEKLLAANNLPVGPS